jgi:protein involved in plasmid replication-relaxation
MIGTKGMSKNGTVCDSFCGTDGPKDEAEEIKQCLKTFLQEQLKLELSEEKTLITHASTQPARFLGYDLLYLEDIGMDADPNFRASKEVSESYLHLRHALELNDVWIAALRVKYVNDNFYVRRRISERILKQKPYKAVVDDHMSLIPDGFLDIRDRSSNRAMYLVIELDRGTEQKAHFRRCIRAYKAFYTTGGCASMFGVKVAYTAFVGFVGQKRLQQMYDWTRDELQDDPQLFNLFLFADLPKPLEPQHLLFERLWYTLANDQPIALLEG